MLTNASLREDYLNQVQRVFLSHALAQHPQRNVSRRKAADAAAINGFCGVGNRGASNRTIPLLQQRGGEARWRLPFRWGC